jgi:hypothetical protein
LFPASHGKNWHAAGTHDPYAALLPWAEKEKTMPVFILWAVPAAIVLAGGTYLIFLK